jgi:ATP synthase, F1 epsilon subunit (delta in mitochondria)
MKVSIISPERKIFSGEVDSITLPGINGSFTILKDHAPIISILIKGKLAYKSDEEEAVMDIDGGFIEMKRNEIIVCVE